MLPQDYRIGMSGGAANLEFNNITTTLPAECQYNIVTSVTTCNYSLILGDGSNVSQPPYLSNATYLHNFVVFKRDLLVSVDFDFVGIVATSTITAIEISFLNSPINSISLPEVAFDEIETGSVNSSREVVFTTPLYNTVQPSADDLSRGSIDLVCTIASEGQYTWMWAKENSEINNNDSYRITVGDGSRTTNLTIESLNFSHTGDYKCTVTTYNRTHSVEYLVEYPGKVYL